MSDELDESDGKENDKLISGSGPADKLGTVMGGLLRGVELPLGVMLSADELCYGDG